jgi:hypothetical protein
MEKSIKALFSILPLMFGVGFIAPLIGQAMAAWGWSAPMGMSHVGFGLLIGGLWGLYANLRGRWI